jgi:uncharacterized membrane protein (UPF0127 family)
MSSGNGPSTFIVENVTRKRVIAARIRSAKDSAARRRGLLDATELDSDAGIWLNPCEAVHTFGMQVPLDVMFLDAGLRVRKIAAQIKPNRIAFCFTADSVLEIGAGGAAASGTECGDQLLFHPVREAVPVSTVQNDDIR